MRVVVVSSSIGINDMPFLDLAWPTPDEEPKAVVSRPGDMTVAVDAERPTPGTA